MTEWLNYHHLFYFKTIATEGGIAKAAEKLRLGQPTLSTQLRQLEDSLGHALFDRRNRSLQLTEAGKLALEYANEIFRMGDEMQEALDDHIVANRTHVAIGAIDSVPKHIIQEMVIKTRELSHCSISILEGKGDELLRELAAHRIDLLISDYPPPVSDTEGLYARSIAKLNVSVFGAPESVGLRKDFPRSVEGKPFILPTRHSKLRHDLDHYFKINEISIDVIAETQDTSLQKLLGTSGTGLVPLAESAADDLIKAKSLIKLGRLENLHEEIWLISASRKIQNPVAANVMKSVTL